ncbi:hypothetical protein GCM10010404_86620 [Nonomuraea africana]
MARTLTRLTPSAPNSSSAASLILARAVRSLSERMDSILNRRSAPRPYGGPMGLGDFWQGRYGATISAEEEAAVRGVLT